MWVAILSVLNMDANASEWTGLGLQGTQIEAYDRQSWSQLVACSTDSGAPMTLVKG